MEKLNSIINELSDIKPTNTRDRLKPVIKDFHLYLDYLKELDPYKNLDLLTQIETLFLKLPDHDLVKEFSTSIDIELFYKFGNILVIQLTKLKSPENRLKNITHAYLDIIHHNSFLVRIYGDKKWEDLILRLIQSSGYTVQNLFVQRESRYSNKILFREIKSRKLVEYKWSECRIKINKYASSIFVLLDNFDKSSIQVAFLMKNSIDMALLDLACLIHGLVNVMIPSNSVAQNIEYILKETSVPLLFVSDEKQLSKIKSIKKNVSTLKQVVLTEGISAESWVLSFDEFLNNFGNIDDNNEVLSKSNIVKPEDVATIMYTSGTTGEPKGIVFTHLNLIYKRFCRALAIPKLGDEDRFLSYLPLNHTFGRFFELLGAIFWGAEYCFLEDTSLRTLISNMKIIHPTIFISIPQKWIQLYDYIGSIVDIEVEEIDIVKKTFNNTLGGKLKWGLSAAGFLSPDIFQFFQRYGVELMSGFGMTEATGGITMTSPGSYKPNSLGKALPGIDIKLGEDGELLIKGRYVMKEYLNKSPEETFVDGGWFPTGDIMKIDKDGYIEIIDRKKEIYKNIRGETIAPQKIENYFYEFDSVKHVFVVGDHRPYNTLLIYPNFESEYSIIEGMSDEQQQDYFSSLVVTVNKFLAPFERIVDFRIIDRMFNYDKGELTPKGTFKRKKIEQNFSDIISGMYVKNYLSLYIDEVEIRIPNWFLREVGCLSSDIQINSNKIYIKKIGKQLNVKIYRSVLNTIKIGDYKYLYNDQHIDLQTLFTNTELWLGNENLYNFAGDSIIQWQRKNLKGKTLTIKSRSSKRRINKKIRGSLIKLLNAGEFSIYGLHQACILLQSVDHEDNDISLKYFSLIVPNNDLPISKVAFGVLKNPELIEKKKIRQRLFKLVTLFCSDERFEEILKFYLELDPELLETEIIEYILSSSKKPDKLDSIINVLHFFVSKNDSRTKIYNSTIIKLFKLLSLIGIKHPSTYKRIRKLLVEFQLDESNPDLAKNAHKFRTYLRKGFRNWFGSNQSIAVDIETGDEYGWEDLIIFEERIEKQVKIKIKNAIINTPILREAVFLFFTGKIINLSNILPSGVWISHLRDFSDKSIYRVTIQTRFQGSFDILLNLVFHDSRERIFREINWKILVSSDYHNKNIVEDFGGYWSKYCIWTSSYNPGESVNRYLKRESNKKDVNIKERLNQLWPYLVWNASAAYIKIWSLTGYQYFLEFCQTSNFIIPSHDYQYGTKILSLSEIKKFNSLYDLFYNFYENFVSETQKNYPFISRDTIWDFIFSGIITSEGQESGLNLLKKISDEIHSSGIKLTGIFQNFSSSLNNFIRIVSNGDFIPMQLYFAIKRFNRWLEINPEADINAQAQMLNELYDTYRLDEIKAEYPEVRIRFYLETAFSKSQEFVKNELSQIIKKIHSKKIGSEEKFALISNIHVSFELTDKENYFLARLTHPYLKPGDTAEITKLRVEDPQSINLIVKYEDYDGSPFYIRNPFTPKEISKLHQLFIQENLMVNFKEYHEFLVVISDRDILIGGIFYLFRDDSTVHMEKIVIANKYRRKGISDKLMKDFFDRIKNKGAKYITTGFFRPEYFYKFGFKIERKYSGFVKKL
ncbi:GNAT family N-acetyltransferase [Bacteroidota bacterium]